MHGLSCCDFQGAAILSQYFRGHHPQGSQDARTAFFVKCAKITRHGLCGDGIGWIQVPAIEFGRTFINLI